MINRFLTFLALGLFASTAWAAHTSATSPLPHASITTPPLTYASTGYPATISIETIGANGSIHSMSWLPPLTADYLIIILSIMAGVLFVFSASQMRATARQLRKSQLMLSDLMRQDASKTGYGNITDAVSKLCDKNQLVRLAAIHSLGQSGLDNPRNLSRIAAILEAYIKAITSDEDLKRSAKPEILACLRELSSLNTLASSRATPFVIDLARTNLSHLPLRHLNLSGADLSGADLKHCLFSWTHLRNATLDNAQVRHAEFRHCHMEDASLLNTEWAQVLVADCSGITVPAPGGEKVAMPLEMPDSRHKLAVRFLESMPPLDKTKLH